MSNIAPLFIVALCVLSGIAAVSAYGYDGYYPGGSAHTAAGGIGGQYTSNEGAHETHNDKDLAIKLGSKQGSSSNFKNTHGQAAAHGAQAHVQQPGYHYPGGWPQHGGWYPYWRG
ncbi:unnamed protein product [Orchesella dallaii]|uniref:Uncharacterized protein n=1 Tax=Orchesella dallaii TaxID=48710 RepID=A0ABP1QU97_9HEXA